MTNTIGLTVVLHAITQTALSLALNCVLVVLES